VPGFGEGTRNAAVTTRIFDNLQVTQPVERMNWSVNTTGELFLPLSKHRRPPQVEAFTLAERLARVERQTLRKLPRAISSSPSASISRDRPPPERRSTRCMLRSPTRRARQRPDRLQGPDRAENRACGQAARAREPALAHLIFAFFPRTLFIVTAFCG
jgi:hypothetical protein